MHTQPVIVAGSLWFLLSVGLVVLPLRSLALTPWLIDDSFIFMHIARNLATGNGYSFDGITATTGAPPLWTLITSLHHHWFDPTIAAKITLIESTFFSMAASLMIYALASQWYNHTVSWGAFAFSMLAAPLFFQSMNGMETGLFACIGVSAVYTYLQARTTELLRWYAFTGVLLGLLNLTRMDGIFLAGALGLVHLVYLFKHHSRQRVMFNTAVLAALMVLVTLPMLIWVYQITGGLLPENQVGRRFLAWQGIAWFSNDYFAQVASLFQSLRSLFQITTGIEMVSLLVFLLIWMFWHQHTSPYSVIIILYIITFCGTLLLYQWYFPDVHGLRYLHTIGHLVSIPIAAMLYAISLVITRRFARYAPWLYSVLLAVLLLSSAFHYQQLLLHLEWTRELHLIPLSRAQEQKDRWEFIDWIETNIPPGSVVAAKDHGQLAYFTDVQVVDLAGIIETDIIDALLADDLRHYLHSRGVQYVILPVEENNRLLFDVRTTLNLEPVADAPETSPYRLYRVIW